jgi:6-phosphogluconolactonase
MVHVTSRRHGRLAVQFIAAVAAVSTLFAPSAALADSGKEAVYTLTNAASGNSVIAFSRASDGTLRENGAYPTGGAGSGNGLGSGHSLVVSADGKELVVVNAGSNSISLLAVDSGGLRLIGPPVDSRGVRPTSVTMDHDLVYVMNAGSNSIAGFRIDRKSGLAPIPGAIQALGAGAANASQIQFDKSGRVLIVDERGSSTIDTFVVDDNGVAGPARTTPSNAGGPFGFDVDRQGHILFSATSLGGGLMSGATSYDVARDGALTPNGGPVSSGQAAACWLAAAGHYAYTTNAASGSIGRFAIAQDGSLSHLGTTVVGPGSTPLDNTVSHDQQFMYALLAGSHQIVGYRVGADGSLTQVTSVAVPVGAAGMAAR